VRLLLIVNPTASSMTPRRRVRIQRELGRHHRLEVAETFRRGHATRLARAAAREGVDAVVVLAGDGTLNEAADGLAGRDGAGTVPRWLDQRVRTIVGMHKSLDPAFEQLVAAPIGARSASGIGSGDAAAAFHLGAGFDAEVIEQVRRHHVAQAPLRIMFAVARSTCAADYERPRTGSAGGWREPRRGFLTIVRTTPYAFFGPRPLTVTRRRLDRRLACLFTG
jgi:diacylglycerol kinase family enzyme